MEWLTSGGWAIPAVAITLAVVCVLTVKYAVSRRKNVMPGRVGIFYGRDFKWKDNSVHGHLLLTSGGRVQRVVYLGREPRQRQRFVVGRQKNECHLKNERMPRITALFSFGSSSAYMGSDRMRAATDSLTGKSPFLYPRPR